MSTLAGSAQIVSRGDPLPDFDIHCPLLSLPLAFATRLETIPSKTPYLSASEIKTTVWRDRLGKHERLRVGLVWAGNPRKELPNANLIDRQRSIEFDRLAPLFQVTKCEFYSLQKGDDAVAQLRDSPLRQEVIDWTDDLHDFSDTAALIENLDLIISVDTSVVHLAGALGKPFWLLNRYNTCWRWLLDREDVHGTRPPACFGRMRPASGITSLPAFMWRCMSTFVVCELRLDALSTTGQSRWTDEYAGSEAQPLAD
jgi:hypothetical protein